MGKRTITTKNRFEYKDAKSHKFWQIESIGSLINIRYGKVGTDGQLIIKKTKSTDAAIAAAMATASADGCKMVRNFFMSIKSLTR